MNLNMAMQNAHHHIEGLFDGATDLTRDGEDDALRSAVVTLLTDLAAHHRAEDDNLFPRLAVQGDTRDLVEGLHGDHTEMVTLMAGVSDALGPEAGLDRGTLTNRLRELETCVVNHFAREERDIDPWLDRLDMPRADVDTLLGLPGMVD